METRMVKIAIIGENDFHNRTRKKIVEVPAQSNPEDYDVDPDDYDEIRDQVYCDEGCDCGDHVTIWGELEDGTIIDLSSHESRQSSRNWD